LAGFAVIWFSSPWGIGVGYDSIFYLSAAENLLSGSGLSRLDGFGNIIPLTHFPPLYPLLLAALSFILRMDMVSVSGLLSAISFGCLVFLTGWLVYSTTKNSIPGILSAMIVLSSPVLLDLQFLAMTESIFLVFLLSMFWFLNKFFDEEKTWQLICASILAGFAYLTRYVGLSAVICAAFAVVVFSPGSRREKIYRSLLTFVVGLIPIVLWYLRNWLVAGTITNRNLIFHPPDRNQLMKGLDTINLWFLPFRVSPSLRFTVTIILTVSIILGFVWLLLRKRGDEAGWLERKSSVQYIFLLSSFIIIYLSMLIVSLTFFDASTRLNDRILSPVYLIGMILGIIILWNVLPMEDHSWLKATIVVIIIGFIGVNFLRSTPILSEMNANGRGFTGRQWQASETITAVQNLSPDAVIYSNEALPIYFITGRPANNIPEKIDPVKNQIPSDYEDNLQNLLHSVQNCDGVLVIFRDSYLPSLYPPLEEFTSGMTLQAELPDGWLYSGMNCKNY
jgi:hypothetical protein